MRTFLIHDWRGHGGAYSPYLPYERFVAVQEEMARRRIEGLTIHDALIITTHPPTITMGAGSLKKQLASIRPLPPRIKESSDPDDLLLARATSYLWRNYRINLVKTNRGGSVWYHDHGVLQLYLIAEVEPFAITSIIYPLEEILLRVLSNTGVTVARAAEEVRQQNKSFIGIWARDKKIAALGIRITGNGIRFVSAFGASINVKRCKQNSTLIDPCGILNCQMTSIANELNDDYNVSHSMLLPMIYEHIQDVFDATIHNKKGGHSCFRASAAKP